MSAAWEFFREGNGAASLDELRRLIKAHVDLSPRDDPEIGCVLLRDVTFFPRSQITSPPPDSDPAWKHTGPMWSDPRLRRERLGQRGFQVAVLNAYKRKCAISGTKIWPALQAAHIVPVTRGGEHRIDNGLLLRSDIHTMFDRGFLGVDTEYRLRVSPLSREVFGNGDSYYDRHGQVITLPERDSQRPGADFLDWHMHEV